MSHSCTIFHGIASQRPSYIILDVLGVPTPPDANYPADSSTSSPKSVSQL